MTRVVTLTPASVQSDSRTYKQASSLARLGYESIVVEGLPSRVRSSDLPFELLTVTTLGEQIAGPPAGTESGSQPTGTRVLVGQITAVLGRFAGPVYYAASLLAFTLRTFRQTPRADVYYVHGMDQGLAVLLLSLRHRAPFIYDAHDLYWALTHDGRRLSPAARATQALRDQIERALVGRATAVVTTSDPMAQALEARFARTWAVLRNLQDLRLTTEVQRGVRAVCGISDEACLIVMVGTAKPGSAVPEALKAIAALPERVHIAFVGGGYEHFAAEVAQADLRHRVHLLAPVAPTEVTSFVRDADLAALLYVHATANTPTQLPNGLFHAIAAGLPVLYPRAMPAVAELCAGRELGIAVDPGSPESLVSAVRALLTDPVRLRRLRANVSNASAELSWEREEPALAALLASTLADRQRA